MKTLFIATRNAHKTDEIRQIIGHKYEVSDANSRADLPAVEETGTTFLENATLKALAISKLVSGYVLSDDSGLEVDALGGAPGVYSSSYGGEEGNHSANNARLISALSSVPAEQRAARFSCTMVLAREGTVLADFTGFVEGMIISGEEAMRGTGGFGYDPLFIPSGYDKTFAELGSEVKNSLSHRGRALAQVVKWLAEQSH